MDFLVQDEPCRERREHETERRQGPDEAHIALGQQVKQGAEENGFEGDAEQDARIGDAAADDPQNCRRRDPLRFANLSEASAQKHDPHRFENERDQQHDQYFGHVTNPGNESASRCAVQPVNEPAG